MPRAKYGLGQGLDALTSPRQRPGGWPESELLNRHPNAPGAVPPELVAWEYACLTERRRRKKRKRPLTLQLSHPEINVRPRKRTIRGVSKWTALGVLGADGWELVGLQGRSLLLKRVAGA
jgi:hypothetical protein